MSVVTGRQVYNINIIIIIIMNISSDLLSKPLCAIQNEIRSNTITRFIGISNEFLVIRLQAFNAKCAESLHGVFLIFLVCHVLAVATAFVLFFLLNIIVFLYSTSCIPLFRVFVFRVYLVIVVVYLLFAFFPSVLPFIHRVQFVFNFFFIIYRRWLYTFRLCVWVGFFVLFLLHFHLLIIFFYLEFVVSEYTCVVECVACCLWAMVNLSLNSILN